MVSGRGIGREKWGVAALSVSTQHLCFTLPLGCDFGTTLDVLGLVFELLYSLCNGIGQWPTQLNLKLLCGNS